MKEIHLVRRFTVNCCCCCFLFFIFVGCKKDPQGGGGMTTPAKGSLPLDEYGNCNSSKVYGYFYNGFPASTDTNYVEVNIRVTSPGSYNITTDKINGVTFSATGNLTDTGLQVVRLKGTGSFISPGATVFPIKFDSSSCSFSVLVQDSAGLSIEDNTWTFTAEGKTYKGYFRAGWYNIPQSQYSQFELESTYLPTGDRLALEFNGVDASYMDTTTTYTSDMSWASYFIFDWWDSTGHETYYYAGIETTPDAVVKFRWQSIVQLPVNGWHVKQVGLFSGTVIDSSKNKVRITQGKVSWID